jgi:hypothetical protein
MDERSPAILSGTCARSATTRYAKVTEPSSSGGAKIANAIKRVVTRHDFKLTKTEVYT